VIPVVRSIQVGVDEKKVDEIKGDLAARNAKPQVK
jgi:hypothetical protein